MPPRPRPEPLNPDEARLLPRMRRYDLEVEQAKLLARILLETDETLPEPGRRGRRTIGHRSGEADPARLRGLPAIGRNVSGAIPGSDPVRALLAKERRRGR